LLLANTLSGSWKWMGSNSGSGNGAKGAIAVRVA
jgi:hypothetical protein